MDFINFYEKAINDFNYFAENSLLSILIIQKGFIKYFNQKFLDLLGYTKEEILSLKKREFFSLLHLNDLNQLFEKMKVEDEKTIKFEARVITKKDKTISVEVYLYFVSYDDKPAYMVCMSPIAEKLSNDIIYNIKSDFIYNTLRDISDKTLDLYLILCKKILNAFAKEDHHYVEKLVMNLHDIILEVKEERLFNKS